MNNASEETVEAKRTEFRNLLHQLAQINQNGETVNQYYTRLEKIYQNGFHHYYCDITRTMYDITKCRIGVSETPKISTEIEEDIDVLASRVLYLYENYKAYRDGLKDSKKKHIDINENLRKLYDHVHLESIRINYSDIGDKRLTEQGMTLENLAQKVNDLDGKAQSMGKEFDEIHKKSKFIEAKNTEIEDRLSKAQTDYIAILGIFASVVLAFVGGMAFSTSVLENMKDVSIYRLLIVSFVIGLVFVTVIFLMFYFVGILSNRKINGDGSLKPLLLIYALFISLIIIVYGMWNMGAVESRNTQIMRRSEVVDLESTEVSITSDITDDICVEQQNDAAAE